MDEQPTQNTKGINKQSNSEKGIQRNPSRNDLVSEGIDLLNNGNRHEHLPQSTVVCMNHAPGMDDYGENDPPTMLDANIQEMLR